MSDAASWLATRIDGAPAQLRDHMTAALAGTDASLPVAEQLALAAADCLTRALAAPSSRASALDLLAADALLTHACESAAGTAGELAGFASRWNTARFEQLLTARTHERSR